MTNVLNIQMLGGFQLSIAEDVIDFRSRRVQSLLAFILLHRHNPQPRQQIASHLWPDSPESQARANLRKRLHQLRQTLPDASHFLQIETDILQWREDAGFTYDVAQFEKCVSQAKATPLLQHEALLKQAAELYRGDLLPACYDDWILPWREQLRQTYGSVLYDLVHLLEEQKKYRNAILYAQQLSRLTPLREAVYRRLMRLYSLNGDRAGAIETFRRCEQLLREELTIEPSAATYELYTQILAASRQIKPRHNLRQQHNSFVDRKEELAIILNRLQNETCRLLTLIGPGGIGKTRLALQVAQILLDEFADGIFLVSLEPVSTPNLLVTAVAEALNFSFYSPQDLKKQLLNYLRPKQLLLVLDNFEQLLEAADLLADLLQQAPDIKLLVTSRERLKLPSEWLLEVEGLPWPETNRADDLEMFGAVQLFVQRARKIQPRLAWSDQEREAVVRICRILDGMPLGIELAAAWLRVLPCVEIERELSRNLDILAGSRPDLPPRHRGLRAVFTQSWNFLSASERRLWTKLTVFHGRFDRQAAAQVAGASLSSLMALVDKSLLGLEGTGLFSLHGSMRQYGREKLKTDTRELAATESAHGEYYLGFLQACEQALLGRQQHQMLVEIAGVIENIRAAWQWAVSHHQTEKLIHAANPLARFYQMRGWFEEGREQFNRAITQTRQRLVTPKSEPQVVLLLSHLLIHEGLFHLRLSHFDQAARVLEEAITISRSHDSGSQALARALICLGEVRYREGEYRQTQQLCREGLALSQALAETDDAARALSLLAQVAQAQGNYDESYQFFLQSRAYSEALGNSWSLAHCYNNLGTVRHDQGQYDEGWQHFQKSLALFRELEDRWGQALVTNNMGVAAMSRLRFDEANEQLQESLKLRREFGNRWAVAFTLNNLGELNFLQGRYAVARDYCRQSLAIRRDHDDRQGIALCLNNLGDIALGMGEIEAAEQQYLESLQIALALQNKRLMTSGILGMAKVLSHCGLDKTAPAVELLALVKQHPASTTKAKEEAGQLLTELAANLPIIQPKEWPHRDQARSLTAVVTDLVAGFTPTKRDAD